MKNKLIAQALSAFLLLTSACFHTNQKIDRLPIRATKSDILKRLGKPYEIKWRDGKAYWTYKFTVEGRHYTRDIIIKEGALYKKSGFKPFPMTDF